MSEDVPYGLVVTRGIAELAGVETSKMDELLMFCQKMSGKEYLKDDKVCGKDIGETRSPQRYGYTDLHLYMVDHKYVNKEE